MILDPVCGPAGITLGEDGLLTIERVKKEDEGLYECVATNVVGSVNTSAVVTVTGRWHREKDVLTKAMWAAARNS